VPAKAGSIPAPSCDEQLQSSVTTNAAPMLRTRLAEATPRNSSPPAGMRDKHAAAENCALPARAERALFASDAKLELARCRECELAAP
jgi:hypothetical protein